MQGEQKKSVKSSIFFKKKFFHETLISGIFLVLLELFTFFLLLTCSPKIKIKSFADFFRPSGAAPKNCELQKKYDIAQDDTCQNFFLTPPVLLFNY